MGTIGQTMGVPQPEEVADAAAHLDDLHERLENAQRGWQAMLDAANRAEYRAQLASDERDRYVACERRARSEAATRLHTARNAATKVMLSEIGDVDPEQVMAWIGEALAEIHIARALTVAMLPKAAVQMVRACDALEEGLAGRMLREVAIEVGEEVAS